MGQSFLGSHTRSYLKLAHPVLPALKVVQVTSDSSGTATPRASDQPSPTRKLQKGPQLLGKGPGGVAVTEVVNLWRGSMAVGKGVNDVDWGAGCECNPA